MDRKLLGLRQLQRHLRSIIGEVDIGELRRLADANEIPHIRLRDPKGRAVFGFDGRAVELALLARASVELAPLKRASGTRTTQGRTNP